MRKDAQHFEALKYSLRQSKDGVVVSFVIQPEDVRPELMALPIGSRVMIAWSQIGDDEKPVARVPPPNTLSGCVTPEPPQAPETKERRAFHTLLLAQQCAIRCSDAQFQDFYVEVYDTPVVEDGVSLTDEVTNAVRRHCGIESRSELGKGNHDADNKWRKLNSEFEAWELDQRYADVRR